MDHWTILVFSAVSAVYFMGALSQEIDWTSTTCKQTADVIFVVDTSSSIWPPHFNKNTKNFIKGIIGNFNVGPGVNESRIGLIQFSTRVYREFQLKDYSSIEAIDFHINRRMRYRGGNTYTHKALDYVARRMLTAMNGWRENVTTLVIIITDGESGYPAKTRTYTDVLKKKGVEVFAIGIGPRVREDELKYMASDPDQDFVFHVKSFSTIGDIEKRFANQTCKALKAAAATTTTTTTTTEAPTTTTTSTEAPTTTPKTTEAPTTTPTTTEAPTTTLTTTEAPTTTATTSSTTTTTPTMTTTTTQTTTTSTPTTTTTSPTTTTQTTTTSTPTTTTTTPTTTTSTTTPTTTSTTTTTTPTTTTTTITSTIATSTTTETPLTTSNGLQNDHAVTKECQGKPADIYFLLDASSSVWIGHFHDRVLPFVRNLVKSFEISPMKTRIGLVTFSDEIAHVFSLAKHRNLKSLLMSLQPENVKYLTGGTNTGDAISFVTKHGLGDGASRKDVAKIIITVTDGMSQDPWKTKQAAKSARDNGIVMFAIGVGKQVDVAELSSIASDPNEDYVFTVDSFKALSSITGRLARKTCSVVGQTPNDEASSYKKIDCSSRPLNVMFLYEYFNSAQNSRSLLDHVIHRFATHAAIHAPYSKIGVMTQPCVGGDIDLKDVHDFQDALEKRRDNFFVTLGDIVRELRLNAFKSDNKKSEKKVAVIALGAHVQNAQALRKELRRLKFQGVQVIALAMGKVDDILLESIVSYPIEQHVIRVDSYHHLEHSELALIERMCDSDSDSSQDMFDDVGNSKDDGSYNDMIEFNGMAY